MVRRRMRMMGWGSCVLLVCFCAACRRGPNLVLLPVSGKVTLAGKPLPRGTVSLRPDSARGNTSLHHPTGSIDAAGRYQVFTIGRPGAPPGKYKVVVFANEEEQTAAGVHPSLPRSIIRPLYNQESTTTLAVEVVENAGDTAYDLRLEP